MKKTQEVEVYQMLSNLKIFFSQITSYLREFLKVLIALRPLVLHENIWNAAIFRFTTVPYNLSSFASRSSVFAVYISEFHEMFIESDRKKGDELKRKRKSWNQ